MSVRLSKGGPRGFFGIAMYCPKTSHNWGTLLRTANLMGADFIATIGKRYKHQAGDTLKTTRHIPMYHYESFEEFYKHLPYGCQLIGVELTPDAQNLKDFNHPEQACYLLGAEDIGLPEQVMEKCHKIVKLEGRFSMNVAVAGSIILYHRVAL